MESFKARLEKNVKGVEAEVCFSIVNILFISLCKMLCSVVLGFVFVLFDLGDVGGVGIVACVLLFIK